MNKFPLVLIVLSVLFHACAQDRNKSTTGHTKISVPRVLQHYILTDYLSNNKQLDKDVEKVFSALDDTAIVAQLIMPAIGRLGQTESTIKTLIKNRLIGGILMLNGSKDEFSNWIKQFEKMNDSIGNLPFLYSADAEPSLINKKIIGSTPVKKANELTSIEEVRNVAKTISEELNAIGINYNFSPVVDMSPNRTVGFRSFGAVPANIIPWSAAFI